MPLLSAKDNVLNLKISLPSGRCTTVSVPLHMFARLFFNDRCIVLFHVSHAHEVEVCAFENNLLDLVC